jgi:hypothetical protein
MRAAQIVLIKPCTAVAANNLLSGADFVQRKPFSIHSHRKPAFRSVTQSSQRL